MKSPVLSLLLFALCILCTRLQWGILDFQAVSLSSLITCHIPHLSPGQLFYAGTVAMLFAAFCESQIKRAHFVSLWLLSSLTVSLGVLLFEGDRLAYFCGASGIGHAFAACWAMIQPSRLLRRAFLLVLIAKVAAECATGTVSYEIGLEGARPIPLAHAIGAAFGMLYGAVYLEVSGGVQAEEESLLRTGT